MSSEALDGTIGGVGGESDVEEVILLCGIKLEGQTEFLAFKEILTRID